LERLTEAWAHWAQAKARFNAAFGARGDLDLRALMRIATSTHLVIADAEP
jgi:hypothetical protein